ncbi:J domain-containing protein [Iningainema tapete]|uniref:DnaJ domain-containing protein n=1 Tax=Iningainema tapete BLCC-T55 TaxID=2748662 RepID=A0A8J7BZ78_9CYAN|nr:DnaJ domain-containing protein [Iningainema tapete]MBD2777032.1 DnaJ domain-containing protein [Iningainema tapete BLCC-T55]
MDLGDYYRLLGLRSGASFTDIKTSYRRLAHRYHPDINPGDNKAKEKFIALTEAYKVLLQVVPKEEISPARQTLVTESQQAKTTQRQAATKTPEKPKPKPPNIVEIEQRLKWKTYEQLQRFLKEKRYHQAIALSEALADRLPEDAEVRQWQAIVYQRWGRILIANKQLHKARIYLKKALKTDPHNKTLFNEVQCDFQRLEQMV